MFFKRNSSSNKHSFLPTLSVLFLCSIIVYATGSSLSAVKHRTSFKPKRSPDSISVTHCGTNLPICQHGDCVKTWLRWGRYHDTLFTCTCHIGYTGKYCHRRIELEDESDKKKETTQVVNEIESIESKSALLPEPAKTKEAAEDEDKKEMNSEPGANDNEATEEPKKEKSPHVFMDKLSVTTEDQERRQQDSADMHRLFLSLLREMQQARVSTPPGNEFVDYFENEAIAKPAIPDESPKEQEESERESNTTEKPFIEEGMTTTESTGNDDDEEDELFDNEYHVFSWPRLFNWADDWVMPKDDLQKIPFEEIIQVY